MKTPMMPKGASFQRYLVVLLGVMLFSLLLAACTRDRPTEGNVATPGFSQISVPPTSTPVPPIAGEPSVSDEISDTASLDGTPAPGGDGGVTEEEYIVESGDTLLSIAIEFGMGVEDLRSLNMLESDVLSVGQPLRVRVTPPTPTPTPEPFLYTVQSGDSLGGIAARFGVSQVDIITANRLVDPNALRVGMDLTIPGFAPQPTTTDAASGSTGTAGAVTHVVAAGESLGQIARDYGVTMAELISANAIANPNSLRVGTSLVIPGLSPQEFAEANAIRHTVAAGESLSIIAQQYGITTVQLMAANNLSVDTIRVGQELIVPQP